MMVQNSVTKNVVVQKYGGATLATPEKIRQVAERVATLAQAGVQVVVAVSAMGKTTNQLIDLAQQVSKRPSRRELDMLLTTGERISMALMSMALQDLGCQAISFTGSQAGILTNDAHVNAEITDVKAFRVQEALAQGKVVVLAGFQGVSPTTREITTLGRGGTDTTAVAMAAFLNARHCEILKDVPGVFSADPKVVANAKMINFITFDQMMEMTFWGAKVLHYRCVELAKQKNVNIFIGAAATEGPPCEDLSFRTGTLVSDPSLLNHGAESHMYEQPRIIAVNSHDQVMQLEIQEPNMPSALSALKLQLEKNEIPFPQILSMTFDTHKKSHYVFITAPSEVLHAIKTNENNFPTVRLINSNFCSVTATCTGATHSEILDKITRRLNEIQVHPQHLIVSALSVSLIIDQHRRSDAILALHEITASST